jgi:hypothetical protein
VQIFGVITVNMTYIFLLIFFVNLSLQTSYVQNLVCLFTNQWMCDDPPTGAP